MDELSGAGASRHLPAPSGLRVPTGQSPVELPPGPMHGSGPALPYLPPVPAKPSGPVTGQVAAILVTPSPISDPATAENKRSRLRIVLVAGLILAVAAVVVVFFSPTL